MFSKAHYYFFAMVASVKTKKKVFKKLVKQQKGKKTKAPVGKEAIEPFVSESSKSTEDTAGRKKASLERLQYIVAEQQAVALSAPEGVDIGQNTLRKLARLRLELDKECARIRDSTECGKSGCHWSQQASRCTGSELWTPPSLGTADQMYRRLNELAQLPASQLTRNDKLQIYYHDEYIKDFQISVDRLHKMVQHGDRSRHKWLPFVTEILVTYPVILLVALNKGVAKFIKPVVKRVVTRFLELLRESALFGADLMKAGLWKVADATMRVPGKVANMGLELLRTSLSNYRQAAKTGNTDTTSNRE